MNKLCQFNDKTNVDVLAVVDRFLIISKKQSRTRVIIIDTITGNYSEILNSFLTSFYKAKYIPEKDMLIIRYYTFGPAEDTLLILKSDKYGIYKILETNTPRKKTTIGSLMLTGFI